MNPQEEYSSDYLGLRKTSWINAKPILEYFEESEIKQLFSKDAYKDFVEDCAIDAKVAPGKTID